MKYSTSTLLDNIGYMDLKRDIGTQTIKLKQWDEVKKYLTRKQREDLHKILGEGIEYSDKHRGTDYGEKYTVEVKNVTREIYKDLSDYLEELPF